MRGWNVHEVVNSPDRLKTPLIKKNGSFCEATWNEALSLVSNKLTDQLASDGGASIGVLGSSRCTNEENFLLVKLARAALKTNNVDHPPRLTHAPAFAGLSRAFGFGAMTNSINEIDDADLLMVCGSNTSEQHPAVASRILDAVDRGAKLIVVGPRKHQLARFSDIYLPVMPGTDLALILGMLNVIFSEGLASRSLVDAQSDQYVALEEKAMKFAPEQAERYSGVPADMIRKAAKTYAEAEKAMIFLSTGVIHHGTGTSNILGLADLAIVTGHVGKASCGLNSLVLHCNGQGACDMGLIPNMLTGDQPVADSAVRKKFEAGWGVELPIEDGLNAYEMVKAAVDGHIRSMFILGDDLLVGSPDIKQAHNALEKLDFLAVQDLFLTDTAKLADVVLPADGGACAEGTFTSTERRIQRVRRAVPNPSGKPDWEVLVELLSRCGHSVSYSSPADIMREIAWLTPIYAGVDYQQLETIGGLQWPTDPETGRGSLFLYATGFPEEFPKISAVDFIPPSDVIDSTYPFLMSIGRSYYFWNTSPMTARAPTLRREYSAPLLDYPSGLAEINPEDAKSLGVRDGGTIKLVSPHGELRLQAMVSGAVPSKVVFVPFYLREQASFLTGPTQDPEAKMPTFKESPVRVEKA